MLTFQNSPTLKAFHLSRLRKHLANHRIRQNQNVYWNNKENCGCAVGATVKQLNPKDFFGTTEVFDAYAELRIHKTYDLPEVKDYYQFMLGIPESLLHVEDYIFESLAMKYAIDFPIRFLNAIPVGIDLVPVILAFRNMLNTWHHNLEKKLIELHRTDLYFAPVPHAIASYGLKSIMRNVVYNYKSVEHANGMSMVEYSDCVNVVSLKMLDFLKAQEQR